MRRRVLGLLLVALLAGGARARGGANPVQKGTLPVGTPQIAADKPQREFLRDLVSRVRVAQCAEQVPVYDLAIPLEHLFLGGADDLGRTFSASLADDRPQSLDLTEPLWLA